MYLLDIYISIWYSGFMMSTGKTQSEQAVVAIRRDEFCPYHKADFTHIYEFNSIAEMEQHILEEALPWYQRKILWSLHRSFATSALKLICGTPCLN